MSLEHAILGFLAAGPQTGYDLKTRCFEGTLSHAWSADQAQIYRTLDKLLAREQVTATLIPQRGKPDRRVYEITDAGHEALTEWLATPIDLPSPRDPLLLRLHFAGEMPPHVLAKVLERARDKHEDRATAFRKRLGSPEAFPTCPPLGGERGRELRERALESALHAEEQTIAWIDEVIASTTLERTDGTRKRGAQ